MSNLKINDLCEGYSLKRLSKEQMMSIFGGNSEQVSEISDYNEVGIAFNPDTASGRNYAASATLRSYSHFDNKNG